MRSFRLFRKSKNIMPNSPEKLTREDKKRITQNVENRLGLNDARPRLGGGPVMAALTAMAMLTLMVAGATALQIGTVLFNDPYAPLKINYNLKNYMEEKNISSISELTGSVIPW